MTVYYNDIDPFAAEWLKALISAGHIAPGDVDTRSIADVRPSDLAGYAQCHFFAGIGVWSYALRRAGWPDSRPVWTGSCPCQPFSAAGKGGGFTDERHLWPHFHWLIAQCRPDVVLGEQVASKDGLAWIDLVQADLEGSGYASGAVDTCAAGFGAPHIRQRLYWIGERLADADKQQWDWGGDVGSRGRGELANVGTIGDVEHAPGDGREPWRPEPSGRGAPGGCGAGRLGNPDGARTEAWLPEQVERQGRLTNEHDNGSSRLFRPDPGQPELGGVADTDHNEQWAGRNAGSAQNEGFRPGPGQPAACAALAGSKLQQRSGGAASDHVSERRHEEPAATSGLRGDLRPGPTNGQWADVDWLYCRDGKWRPVEPGTFPLAHGAPARVGRLRGYGNAINAEAATCFIEAYLETQALETRHIRLTDVSEAAANEGIFG